MKHIYHHIATGLALAVILAIAPPAFAESVKNDMQSLIGDPVSGKVKSQSCQGCHGITGHSNTELIPKLAGQYETYIVKQMRNYLSGIRTHELMNGAAASLSEQDLADIAAYYAIQPMMKGDGSTPNKEGKNLYLQGRATEKVLTCAFCHGETGKGLTAETGMYPIVGGQHKAYLLKQMIDFRDDDRTNSPSVVMNKTVRSLSDRELEALAEYMSVQ